MQHVGRSWLVGLALTYMSAAPAWLAAQQAVPFENGVPVARGLVNPWSLAFLPDGTLLVTEKEGRLRLIRGGVLDPKPADGRFGGRLYEVTNLVEKPRPQDAPSNLAIIGRYVLTPAIFDTLARTPLGTGGELQLTDGLKLLLRQEKIYGYVAEGKRHDTGDKLGGRRAGP